MTTSFSFYLVIAGGSLPTHVINPGWQTENQGWQSKKMQKCLPTLA